MSGHPQRVSRFDMMTHALKELSFSRLDRSFQGAPDKLLPTRKKVARIIDVQYGPLG
jgi:hypothetical protein